MFDVFVWNRVVHALNADMVVILDGGHFPDCQFKGRYRQRQKEQLFFRKGSCTAAFPFLERLCICPHSKKLTLSSVICSTRSAFLPRYPKRFRVTFKCLHIWYMCESRLPPQSPQQTVSQQFYIPFPLFPDM